MKRFNVAPALALSAAALVGATACSSETPSVAESTVRNISDPMVYSLDFVVDDTRVTGDLSVFSASNLTPGTVANMNVTLAWGTETENLDLNMMHCDAENNLTAHVSNENGVNNIITWASSSLPEEIIAEGSFPCKNGDFTVANPTLNMTAERLAKWGGVTS